MTDPLLLDDVRRLRAAGAAPKEIARALQVPPAIVAPLIRRIAAEQADDRGREPALAGCWVSPGWSNELLVVDREGWHDVDVGAGGPAGVALALVARGGRGDQVTVCGYLVDTFCLGVKDALGPKRMRERDLPAFVRAYFRVFPAPALKAPVELACHLVHGAVEFASGLGFAPARDFEAARGHLGELDEPCAITFGRGGEPLYVQGPYDDPIAILATLRRQTRGRGSAAAA